MNNTYFALRHGETPYQLGEKQILYPWPEHSPILLTKQGVKQIKETAKKLKKEKISLIYSSPIPRTRQTAEIVGKELGVKPRFDKRLRERNLGIYKGKPKKEYYSAFTDRSKQFSVPPLNGESWNEVKRRMMNFLKDIDKKCKGERILIVSHGSPLWLLATEAKNLSNAELLRRKKEFRFEVGEFRKL